MHLTFYYLPIFSFFQNYYGVILIGELEMGGLANIPVGHQFRWFFLQSISSFVKIIPLTESALFFSLSLQRLKYRWDWKSSSVLSSFLVN